ncbi:3-carboxy-cis,cis-muconate cycloisomerase [Rhinocladiella mackenziei CBS 650.93]|uniref:Rhinocladiella mackenziei CBS 650.93 unplaced genomic scaffold supercont1.5, whole genome shotgun sequence n=1 Tax=Rhinocladiella mackenziei CBS 650.93 TaxID=1442369 RepID=A0A0D2IB29_9EURO|nr:3-carboxy-cis,cis-muconate cycloisomerase [Rhinocladiella mackenziei CBS 650.93]KIX03014.1 3-carboxy-cis,cis-muconate cycloisomerase [Rhinocladiella mackenziei CBS 650.93]
MSVSALDSRVFRNLFGTHEIRGVFSDEAYVRRMVEVEAALARAQSQIGVIPVDVGQVIARSLINTPIDFDRLSNETDIVGYPVLPLVRQLVEKTPPDTAKYIHWGATTQDIMDNAAMLQMRDGLQIVKHHLNELTAILRHLSQKYRDTPMAGRTHLQHALPATFGYKCAVYLSSILRHSERLPEIEKRCLLVQFGGAVGTLASLGSDHTGLRVREHLARELGLMNPSITWHAARDNVAEIVNFLALVGGSLGKIAYDLILMSSNELGEVSEPFVPHRGASSTMPQKRNPISSEVILAASKLLRANAGLVLDAMVADFERASGPWHLEWVAVPEAFVLVVGALHQTNFALNGLVVNTGAMMKNLLSTQGLIVGEAVMMSLAPYVGRQQAHDLVYEACKQSIESDRPLLDILKERSAITDQVHEGKLKELCDPANYLGASQLMVDEVLNTIGQ